MKATIKPPKEGLVANVSRMSNPFVQDSEPDWIPNPNITGKAPDTAAGRNPVPPPPPPRQRTFDDTEPMDSDADTNLRNTPPAVPRKPLSLSSQASLRGPILRSSTMEQNASAQIGGVSGQTEKVRRASTDLLGDVPGEQIEWKPLLPQR